MQNFQNLNEKIQLENIKRQNAKFQKVKRQNVNLAC